MTKKLLQFAVTIVLFFGILSNLVKADEPTKFRLVLLPDTQIYARAFPDTFYAQTDWIVKNADTITYVLHQGDITDNNVEKQWEVASKALHTLDGKVPYSLAHGNHDLGKNGSTDSRDSTFLNQYFPYDDYSKIKGFGGAYEVGKIDNTWHTFRAGGKNWLVITLEFGPRNCVLDWAKKIVEEHPNHKVIFNTHAYMYSDDTRMGPGDNWLPQDYPIGKETGENAVNDAEQMWEKLVSKYPNIMFVFSGHVLFDGTGFLVSEGEHGNKVYQILANYQMKKDGGEGFLRIVTFDTANKKIEVESYSPLLDQFNKDADQQFVIENVEF